MSEKVRVFKEAIKQKGNFNYSDLYNFCYELIKEEGYKLSEDVYTEKVSSFGKEIIIEWSAKKKISDYFQNLIKLKWHILGMNDAETERNGKKVKTNKGEVKITFSADLEKDYESRWEDQPFWKTMRSFYEKYIIRTTIDEYEDRLEDKARSFVEEIKAFLELEGRR